MQFNLHSCSLLKGATNCFTHCFGKVIFSCMAILRKGAQLASHDKLVVVTESDTWSESVVISGVLSEVESVDGSTIEVGLTEVAVLGILGGCEQYQKSIG